MTESSNKKLYIGLVISMLIWGLGWPSTKILTQFGSPLHLAIIRFAATFLTLLLILFILKEKLSISRNGFWSLLMAAALMSVYTMFFLVGVKKGSPGAGGILVTTLTPIATYVISLLMAKRKPAYHEVLGLFLGIVAACFLVHIWEGPGHLLHSGNLFFLLSCVTWAVLSRITARAKEFGSPLTFTLWLYGLCFVLLLPFAHPSELQAMLQIERPVYWVNLFYNASINTGLATTFYFFATSRLGASRSSSFLYIVPCAAGFFSWLILGETFHWNTMVGGVLGIAAVYVLNAGLKWR